MTSASQTYESWSAKVVKSFLYFSNRKLKCKQFRLKQKHPSGKFPFPFLKQNKTHSLPVPHFLNNWAVQVPISYAVRRWAAKDLRAIKLGKQAHSNPSYRNDGCFWSALQSLSVLGFLIKSWWKLAIFLASQIPVSFKKSNSPGLHLDSKPSVESETEHGFP